MPTSTSRRGSRSSSPRLLASVRQGSSSSPFETLELARRNGSQCKKSNSMRWIYEYSLWTSIEDDSGPKFMAAKHPDDLNSVDWYCGDWVDWHEDCAEASSSDDRLPIQAKNIHDYKLIVGPSGEMELPDPGNHPSGYNWSSALSHFIQIAWGMWP